MKHPIKCSRCKRDTLRMSHRNGARDHLMARIGFRPMRCPSCMNRKFILVSRIPEEMLALVGTEMKPKSP